MDTFGAYGRIICASAVGDTWRPPATPYHLPIAVGGWGPLSQGTLRMHYVPLPPSGTSIIFRDGKVVGHICWGSGKGFLGSSNVSTTTNTADGVGGIP